MGVFGWSYPPGAANDPNAPYNQDADWGLDMEELRKALEAHDTGKWDWEKIQCCLTGKDADLEPWGQQGIELVSCDDDKIECIAHIYATEAGTDICLNLEPEIEEDDARMERIHEAYLEQAQEVVCGCSVPGEWDGDSWALGTSEAFSVPWVMDGTDVDYEETAQRVVDAAKEALRPYEDELVRCSETLNILAGWMEPGENGDAPTNCAAGKPGKYAVWHGGEE